jgi:hypothetical protein
MSGRFYDPNPVYFNLLSNQPVAGGFLTFYLQGTTTPKGTWSDSALTIPNTNPVPLDSSGRANVNIWLSGAYSVRLTDSQGAVIWTRDVDDGSAGQAQFPPMESGKFLTNDGSVYLWGDVRQVPDPTGSANKVLSNDGANLIWIAQQTIPDLPIEVLANAIKIKGIMIQWGSGSAPASGSYSTQQAVTFTTAFSETPYFAIPSVNSALVTASSLVATAATNLSATGCTFNFSTADSKENNSDKITSPIPYKWLAIGKVVTS